MKKWVAFTALVVGTGIGQGRAETVTLQENFPAHFIGLDTSSLTVTTNLGGNVVTSYNIGAYHWTSTDPTPDSNINDRFDSILGLFVTRFDGDAKAAASLVTARLTGGTTP